MLTPLDLEIFPALQPRSCASRCVGKVNPSAFSRSKATRRMPIPRKTCGRSRPWRTTAAARWSASGPSRPCRQREELNRTILATAMDGFFTLDFAADPGGAITEVNDAYCRLTGYSREELLQMRIADLEAKESPEEVARHKARIMAAGADRFETRHRRKDGQEIHVEISVSRLAGSSERVFGFVRDITERKRAEVTKEALLSLGTKLNAARSPVEAARAIYASADLLWKWDAPRWTFIQPETGPDAVRCLTATSWMGSVARFLQACPSGVTTPRMRRIMREGPRTDPA